MESSDHFKNGAKPKSHMSRDFLNKKIMINLTDLKFISDDHVRFENNEWTGKDNKGSLRGIRVQSSGNNAFIVNFYNFNFTENRPTWGNNLWMDPKPMVIVTKNDRIIDMIGYGYNHMGDSLSDYGLTLYSSNNNVEIVVLSMYDRNVQIAYLKEGKSVSDKGNLLKELAIWGFDFNNPFGL